MDEILSFEDVDLSAETGEFLQAKENLATLNSYIDDIAKTGGVSRSQAQALVQECGVVLKDQYPIESYTALPSQTNLAVTLESMFETTAQLVWDLIKKAAKLFLKLIHWVIELIKKRREANKALPKVTARAKMASQASAELQAAGLNESVVPPSGKAAVAAAQRELEEAEEKYAEAFNDLVADMVTDGNFLKAVQFMDMYMLSKATIYRDKQVMFIQALKRPTNDVGIRLRTIGELNTVALEVPGDELAIRARAAFKNTDTASNSLSDVMAAMLNEVRALANGKSFDPPAPGDVAEAAAGNINNILAPLPMAPDELRKIMEQLQQGAQQLSAIHQSGELAPELKKAFMAAHAVVVQENQVIQQYWTIVMMLTSARDRFFNALYDQAMAKVKHGQAMAKTATDESLVDTATRILVDLANSLRRA